MMKTPFVGINTVRGIAGQRALFIAVLEVGDGYLCIEHQIGIDQVVVCVAKKENFPRFYAVVSDPLAEVVADLKAKATERSATLEAIQLLGTLTPLTSKEETIMANPKLAKKEAPAAKAAKEPKAKGNGEALAAARAARASKNDSQKIKVLAKTNPYREGTKAANTFDLFKEYNGKTVGDVRAAATDDHDLGYLRYASRDEHIALS